MSWKASGKTDLPLSAGDREWDGDEAKSAIFKGVDLPQSAIADERNKVERHYKTMDKEVPW